MTESGRIVMSKPRVGFLCAALALLCLLHGPLQAQTASAPSPVKVADIDSIRVSQQALDRRLEGIALHYSDNNGVHATELEGVPPTLRTIRAMTVDDIEPVIESVYPYYGFTGDEWLRFTERERIGERFVRYHFDQYINDVRTGARLSVVAELPEYRIIRLDGQLLLNHNIRLRHRFSRQQAIEHILDIIRSRGHSDRFRMEGQHRASLFLQDWGGRILPWWEVRIRLREPDQSFTELAGTYHIDPEGGVIGSLVEACSYSPHGGLPYSEPGYVGCNPR